MRCQFFKSCLWLAQVAQWLWVHYKFAISGQSVAEITELFTTWERSWTPLKHATNRESQIGSRCTQFWPRWSDLQEAVPKIWEIDNTKTIQKGRTCGGLLIQGEGTNSLRVPDLNRPLKRARERGALEMYNEQCLLTVSLSTRFVPVGSCGRVIRLA